MADSARLRADDWRALIRLVGECRELGDDPHAWRSHFAEQLGRRLAGDLCFFGEVAGWESPRPIDLGVTDWGWHGGFDRASWLPMLEDFRDGPRPFPTIFAYLERHRVEPGVSLARSSLLTDREWYGSTDEQICRAIGTDHALFCFRAIPGAAGAQNVLQFHRGDDRRDFPARALALAREAHAALAPLIGGPLARFAEPSPRDLAPRARPVLACLLEGDGDKQVAARLGLSIHTVREYTKDIFRHFGVRSRGELLARRLRRAYPTPSDQVP